MTFGAKAQVVTVPSIVKNVVIVEPLQGRSSLAKGFIFVLVVGIANQEILMQLRSSEIVESKR